jgi:hypothetical protein
MEKEIKEIQQRNKKVEADKAWETSNFRKTTISVITYFLVVLFLYTIKAPKPWLNALIPTAGFILSTLTLPFIKKWWIKNQQF